MLESYGEDTSKEKGFTAIATSNSYESFIIFEALYLISIQ